MKGVNCVSMRRLRQPQRLSFGNWQQDSSFLLLLLQQFHFNFSFSLWKREREIKSARSSMRVCVPSSRRLAVCRMLRFLFASNKNFLLLLLGNDVDVDVDVFVLCTHTDTHAQTDCEHRLRIAKRGIHYHQMGVSQANRRNKTETVMRNSFQTVGRRRTQEQWQCTARKEAEGRRRVEQRSRLRRSGNRKEKSGEG